MQAAHNNYEERPWQRLKKGADVGHGQWHYDVKSRYGHSSKSDPSGEKAWNVVHVSSRNKKQHLKWFYIAESDSDDDDDGRLVDIVRGN